VTRHDGNYIQTQVLPANTICESAGQTHG